MQEELTVIIPVYNEEESLPAFFQEFDLLVEAARQPIHALFVDDGSTDGSLHLIREKCKSSSIYGYISFDRNYGLSAAIKAGFDHCETSLVGYIDADLQTSPSDFVSYFQYIPEYDMINGIRQKRQDSIIKRQSSKFANFYRRLMINDHIEDTCCPLKIMKTDFAKNMPFFNGMHRFMPALVQLQGGRVKQVPITHSHRRAGTSKFHLLNRLVGPFFDTLAFRWMRSRYIRYTVADRNR